MNGSPEEEKKSSPDRKPVDDRRFTNRQSAGDDSLVVEEDVLFKRDSDELGGGSGPFPQALGSSAHALFNSAGNAHQQLQSGSSNHLSWRRLTQRIKSVAPARDSDGTGHLARRMSKCVQDRLACTVAQFKNRNSGGAPESFF